MGSSEGNKVIRVEPHHEINVYTRVSPESLLAFFSLLKHSKIVTCETKSKFPPDTESASTWILDCPASRVIRNEYCCLGLGTVITMAEETVTQ